MNSSEVSRGPIICGGLIVKGFGYSEIPITTTPPTNGTSGTLAGKIAVGGILIDANGVRWINVGTKASPVYSPLDPVTFNVSSANILAMNGAPVALFPSASVPSGFSLVCVGGVTYIMTRTGTAYANGGTVQTQYIGAGAVIHTGTMPASVVTGGAGTAINFNGPQSAANGIVVPTATGIEITNNTAAFITGTGTLKVVVNFRIVKQ